MDLTITIIRISLFLISVVPVMVLIRSGNKKVLYASHQIPKGIFVDLNEIATGKIIRKTEDNLAVLQGERAARMGILLKYRSNDEDIYMSFYDIDSDDPLQMSYNSKRVSKWCDLIAESLH